MAALRYGGRGGQGPGPERLGGPAASVLARLPGRAGGRPTGMPGPAGPSRLAPDRIRWTGTTDGTAGQDRTRPARILLTLRRNWRWPTAFHANRAGAGRFAIIAWRSAGSASSRIMPRKNSILLLGTSSANRSPRRAHSATV